MLALTSDGYCTSVLARQYCIPIAGGGREEREETLYQLNPRMTLSH